jgi:hypothetical protein
MTEATTTPPGAIDENAAVAKMIEQLEAEGMAQSEDVVRIAPSPGLQAMAAEARARDVIEYPAEAATWQPIPIADLRERIAVCKEAWVSRYRDGNIEIVFDTDARRSALVPSGGRTTAF